MGATNNAVGNPNAVAEAENGGRFHVKGSLPDDPRNDRVLLKLKGQQ